MHLIVQTSFNNSFLRKSCLQSAEANIIMRTVNFVSGYKDIFCGLVLSLKSKFIGVFKQVYAKLIIIRQLDRVVDRVKPWLMVHGLAHGSCS